MDVDVVVEIRRIHIRWYRSSIDFFFFSCCCSSSSSPLMPSFLRDVPRSLEFGERRCTVGGVSVECEDAKVALRQDRASATQHRLPLDKEDRRLANRREQVCNLGHLRRAGRTGSTRRRKNDRGRIEVEVATRLRRRIWSTTTCTISVGTIPSFLAHVSSWCSVFSETELESTQLGHLSIAKLPGNSEVVRRSLVCRARRSSCLASPPQFSFHYLFELTHRSLVRLGTNARRLELDRIFSLVFL